MTKPLIHLAICLHSHQPVGNFDSVFEDVYQKAYKPFLDEFERSPAVQLVLHYSGPLLDWLDAHHPDYLDRIKARIPRRTIELIGGPRYEPICTLIPERDLIGQVKDFRGFLQRRFPLSRIRGAWLPERVWEPWLVHPLAKAGVRWALLDDSQFLAAGLDDRELTGPFLSEDRGETIQLIPISEKLRYLIPFRPPEEVIAYLRERAETLPGSLIVYGDDGEKFGSWPGTFDHLYKHGWLRRMNELLLKEKEWLKVVTVDQALQAVPQAGRVYLPDASYREMTEWALPPRKLLLIEGARKHLDDRPETAALKPFVRGGTYRGFRARYPEALRLYSRMRDASNRVDAGVPEGHPQRAAVLADLYRGQCNCAYWHGVFGGLYLPHLREAVYAHLIRADDAASRAAEQASPARGGAKVRADVADFDLDGRSDLRLASPTLFVYLSAAQGGRVTELDLRAPATNLTATLARRYEAYHEKLTEKRAPGAREAGAIATIHDVSVAKEAGLERWLVYDRTTRDVLLDRLLPAGSGHDAVKGDGSDDVLALGDLDYRFSVLEEKEAAHAVLEAETEARAPDGQTCRLALEKKVTLASEGDIVARYRIRNDGPGRLAGVLAVENHFGLLAGDASDRGVHAASGDRLGSLRLDADVAGDRVVLRDGWRGITIEVVGEGAARVSVYPTETVSQSEAGYERLYQSTGVAPRFPLDVPAGEERSIEMRICVRAKGA